MKIDDILEEEALPLIDSKKHSGVPFPQANSVECILQILLNTEEEGSTLCSYIVRNIVNSERQASYYVNAAIYLGLCKKVGDFYYLTGNGLRVRNSSGSRQRNVLASIMLSHPVIGRWYSQVFLYDSVKERLSFLQSGFEGSLSVTTIERRCMCVLTWMSWIQTNLPVI